MKRVISMVLSAAVGVTLLIIAAHQVMAETSQPSGSTSCYHRLWSCSYDSSAYWDGCATDGSGMISTDYARIICSAYHDQ